MNLRRFWFEFPPNAKLPVGIRAGCGITAVDLEDARGILRSRVFNGAEPPVANVIEDVDISGLDPGHVLPNMLSPHNRGVWFPLGYSP